MWCGCPSDLWRPKYCGGHVQMQAISQVTRGQTRSNPQWKGTSILSLTACYQIKGSHNIKIRLLYVTLKVKHFHWGRMHICKLTVPRSSDKVPITLSGNVGEWLEVEIQEIKQRTSSDVRERASNFVNLYQNLLHVNKSLLWKDLLLINIVKETQCYPLILSNYKEITRNRYECKS